MRICPPCVPLPGLAGVIVSPDPDRAAGIQRHLVTAITSDLGDAGQAGKDDRDETNVSHSVAGLAIRAISPGRDRSVGQQSHAVVSECDELPDAPWQRDGSRRGRDELLAGEGAFELVRAVHPVAKVAQGLITPVEQTGRGERLQGGRAFRLAWRGGRRGGGPGQSHDRRAGQCGERAPDCPRDARSHESSCHRHRPLALRSCPRATAEGAAARRHALPIRSVTTTAETALKWPAEMTLRQVGHRHLPPALPMAIETDVPGGSYVPAAGLWVFTTPMSSPRRCLHS